MDKIARDVIGMTWDPVVRLAEVRYSADADVTGDDAAALVAALSDWIGTGGEPFGLLADGTGLRSLDAEYRTVWGGFFRAHRQECCVALCNLGPVVQVAADLFRVGTGLRLTVFAGEDEARAWLREMGVAA